MTPRKQPAMKTYYVYIRKELILKVEGKALTYKKALNTARKFYPNVHTSWFRLEQKPIKWFHVANPKEGKHDRRTDSGNRRKGRTVPISPTLSVKSKRRNGGY